MHFEKYKAQGVIPTNCTQTFNMVLCRRAIVMSSFIICVSEETALFVKVWFWVKGDQGRKNESY